ncbi:Putative signal transducing protein [Shimia haliotis]|uniref:Putative signal transducing protein n=2 Tax=Shimia haliotis TaxID=1280847 RepID=A0A1I4CSB3_9RHOB|nr:Putative signal transducing protein [Shimia haliotis]
MALSRLNFLWRGSTTPQPCTYILHMKELLRSNDPTIIAFASALLQGEGIDCFEMDVNMSVLEGSIGILPRRLMVLGQDLDQAEAVMADNGIALGRTR